MKDIPKLIKYTSKDCRCECGGPAAIEGTCSVRMPIGFGFAPGSSSFQVDCITYSGWLGQCMDCAQRILFWKSKRHSTRHPRNINRKLAAARA